MKAHYLYRDFFEYTPFCKLIIAGNYRPEFRDTGRAMRRRRHLIPFEVTISDEERDLYLADALLQEGDGILGWMLAGCAAWQRTGLAPPSTVRRATEAYFAEEDGIGRWLAECCSAEPTAAAPVGLLYRSFRSWTETVGEEAGSMKAFSQALDRRGFRRARSADRQFQGLRLVGRSFCREDSE